MRSIQLVVILLLTIAGSLSLDRAMAAQPALSPVVGQPVMLVSDRLDLNVQITVTKYEANPEFVKAARGYRAVGARVEVRNVGDIGFDYDDVQILLLDDAGTPTFDSNWRFSQEVERSYPPLTFDNLTPGASAEGWFLFEIPAEARPATLVLISNHRTPVFKVLAWLDPPAPDELGAQTILTLSGQVVGTLKIDAIITHFERTDAGIEPRRGSSTVAVAVTMTNLSDEPWRFADADFWLVDQFGDFYQRTFYDRSMDSFKAFPELGYRAKPDQIARGVLLFELPDYARLDRIVYTPANQFYVVGAPDPDITMSGDMALATMDIDSRESLDSSCAGVDVWAEESLNTIETVAAFLEDVSNPDGDIDAADLRRKAAQVRELAVVQGGLDVPAEAQASHDAIVDLLNLTADELEAGADRIEAGEDPEDVLALLNASQSPINAAANDAVQLFIKLSNTCDFSMF